MNQSYMPYSLIVLVSVVIAGLTLAVYFSGPQ